MDWADHIAAVEREGELLRVAAVRGLGPDVPSCPGWTVADLVSHVGGFYRNRAAIVAERLQEAPPEWDDLPADEVTVEWYIEGLDLLLGALSGAEPDTEVWTWHPPDQTAGFWARRAAHEILIHRVDGELAHGPVTPPDPELAADGVDEVLRVYVGGIPDWAEFSPDGGVVRVRADDVGVEWDVQIGGMSGTSPATGNTYEALPSLLVVDPAAAPAVTIEGAAADMDLWLWGRGPIDGLRITGDPEGAVRLRQVCADDMD